MITIAGDQEAFALIQQVQQYLEAKGLQVENVGALDETEVTPLQVLIPHVVKQVQRGEVEFGILACGSGAGVEIGANRWRGVRASFCAIPEQAFYARQKDDANVLCLSSYIEADIPAILDAWLTTAYDQSPERDQMLRDFDNWM